MVRVLHTAQALVDVVLEVPDLPRRGGNVMAAAQHRYAAGAVTTLLAAARSGARCVHAGSVGTGPNGDLIRSALAAEGIPVASPPVEGLDTGICVVLVEPTGERTFVTTLGAERRITVASLEAAAPVPGDLVCVSGYSLLAPTRDPLLAWLDTLPAGVRVVLDPGAAFADLAPAVRDHALARTWLFTGNLEESEALATALGAGVSGMAGCAQALGGHLLEGAVAVVRDGPHGCAVWSREQSEPVTVPGFPQRPVDTNGAGDTHTGVLVAEVAGGTDLVEAARRANAAGAITVTRRGPDSAPQRSEIDGFLTAQRFVGGRR